MAKGLLSILQQIQNIWNRCHGPILITSNNVTNIASNIMDDNARDIYDYLEIAPIKNSISIGQIREAGAFLCATSAKLGTCVVIRHADMMTLSAANACLKFLEETPNNSHILLIASSTNILPTLKSRCFRINDNFTHEVDNYNDIIKTIATNPMILIENPKIELRDIVYALLHLTNKFIKSSAQNFHQHLSKIERNIQKPHINYIDAFDAIHDLYQDMQLCHLDKSQCYYLIIGAMGLIA